MITVKLSYSLAGVPLIGEMPKTTASVLSGPVLFTRLSCFLHFSVRQTIGAKPTIDKPWMCNNGRNGAMTQHLELSDVFLCRFGLIRVERVEWVLVQTVKGLVVKTPGVAGGRCLSKCTPRELHNQYQVTIPNINASLVAFKWRKNHFRQNVRMAVFN